MFSSTPLRFQPVTNWRALRHNGAAYTHLVTATKVPRLYNRPVHVYEDQNSPRTTHMNHPKLGLEALIPGPYVLGKQAQPIIYQSQPSESHKEKNLQRFREAVKVAGFRWSLVIRKRNSPKFAPIAGRFPGQFQVMVHSLSAEKKREESSKQEVDPHNEHLRRMVSDPRCRPPLR